MCFLLPGEPGDGFNAYGGNGAGPGYPPPPGPNYPQPDQFGRYPGAMHRGPYDPYPGYHHSQGPPDAMGPPGHMRGPSVQPFAGPPMHKMIGPQSDDIGGYGEHQHLALLYLNKIE